MHKPQRQVLEFHRALWTPWNATPTDPPSEVKDLRIRLMREELNEVEQASDEHDITAVAKELADLLYTVYGTACAWGIDMEPIFDAVHRSNMTKERAAGPGHKILKGQNYRAPEIEPLILEQTSGAKPRGVRQGA